MRDKIRQKVSECKRVGGFEELKIDIEENLEMKLDEDEMFENRDQIDLDLDANFEGNEIEIENATSENPNEFK